MYMYVYIFQFNLQKKKIIPPAQWQQLVKTFLIILIAISGDGQRMAAATKMRNAIKFIYLFTYIQPCSFRFMCLNEY